MHALMCTYLLRAIIVLNSCLLLPDMYRAARVQTLKSRKRQEFADFTCQPDKDVRH